MSVWWSGAWLIILTFKYMEKVFLPIILGTNRQGRQSEHVAKFVYAEMQKRDDLTTEFIDVRDFDLPHDNYGRALKDKFPKFKETVIKADGLVLVVPEYNHSFPGILKSVLDLLLAEYRHKAVGVAGVSAGPWGGVRMIESILPFFRNLGLVMSSIDLQFPNVQQLFDEKGDMTQENQKEFSL